MKIELLARDDRDRLRRYEWDRDKDGEYQKEGYASPGSDGLVTFTGIPADAELTVRFHVGSSARKQIDYGYDEIETFGDDLNIGSTVGAFGEMAGAGPEVRICSASEMTTDDYCATFGYVWMTGEMSGNVGDQKDHVVEVEPETGHGAVEKDAKTDKGRQLQHHRPAGRRVLPRRRPARATTPWTVSPLRRGLVVYHDEYADNKDEDKADSAWAGRRAQAEAKWETTRGGLGIMGYVANDDDGNNLVRGNEGRAGITVKLLTDVKFYGASDGATKNGKLKSSKTAETTETANNGTVLVQWPEQCHEVLGPSGGGRRRRRLPEPEREETRIWRVAQADSTRRPTRSCPRRAATPSPPGDRATGDAGGTSVPYTVGTGTAAQTATLYNFGLVYTNGTVAGEVNNVSGSDGNIDVRITTNTDSDALWERTTSSSGEFLGCGACWKACIPP